MLALQQMSDRRTGAPLRGFTVRNRLGRLIAIGATGVFVQMVAKRYANDLDLVAAIGRMTGLSVRN